MHVVKYCQRDQGLCIRFRKDSISLLVQAKEEEIPYSCSRSSRLLPYWFLKSVMAQTFPHASEGRDGRGNKSSWGSSLLVIQRPFQNAADERYIF